MERVVRPILMIAFAASCIIFLSGFGFAGTAQGAIPGFWMGVWHGLLAPYTLIFRLIIDMQMYATPNAGLSYDLGFLIGVAGSIPIGWLAVIVALVMYVGDTALIEQARAYIGSWKK